MKRFLSVLACMALLVGTLSFGLTAEANFGRSYTAPKGSPVLDGEVDDVWATAKWTNVDKVHDGSRDGNSTLRIKCLWDENGFYFLGEVYDTTLNRRNDLIEVYLDQNNDKTMAYGDDDSHTRFYVRTTGVVTNEASGKNAQMDTAESAVAKLDGDRYLVEGKLTWYNGAPKVGDKMGLEFMLHDGTEYQAMTEAYRWNVNEPGGEEQAWASTENWGTLIFADAGEALPENTYVDGEEMQKVEEVDDEADMPTEDVADDDVADEDDAKDADKADKEGGNNIVLYAGIGAAVLVIIIIAIVLAGKKKEEK